MIASDGLESNKLTQAHSFCLCVLDSYSKHTKTGTQTNVPKVFHPWEIYLILPKPLQTSKCNI